MKFEKQILTEGLYVVGDGKGGRKVELITSDRLKHWADQHKKMIQAGLDVTAPAIHNPKAIPENKTDPKRWSATEGSKSNYGFWESISATELLDESGAPVMALNGVLDVPREEDASRIGKTVKSTSIYAVPEFIDGNGNIWKDVLTHIYVGNSTIEPGQKNFLPVREGELAVAMSHRLPIAMSEFNIPGLMEGDIEANSEDLWEMLEKVAGLAVPRGISPELLPQALLAALKQKQLSEAHREGGTVSKPPSKSQLHEVPVVMSTNQQSNGAVQQTAAPGPVKTEVIPPDNKTSEAVSMSQFQDVQQQNSGLLTYITGNKKTELKNRLALLRQRNIISDDETFKNFIQKVDGITSMSFDDQNQVIPTIVESQISALEAVRVPMPTNQPIVAMATQDAGGNFVIQPNPTPVTDPGTDVTEERASSIVDALMGGTSA